MPKQSSKPTTSSSVKRAVVPEAQLNLLLPEKMESVAVDQGSTLMQVSGGATLVDANMVEALSKHKWHIGADGYVRRNETISRRPVSRRTVLMHRFIMGDVRGIVYDHKNGVRLDNRRANLRVATCAGNSANARKRINARHDRQTSSRYKGVTFRKDSQRWQAYIGAKPCHKLGCFATEELAAAAYNKAAIVRFGEFARLNVIK